MRNKLLIILLLSAVFLSGCSLNFNVKKKGSVDMTNNGGIYVSPNQGQNWVHMTAVPDVSGNKSIGFINVRELAVDPSDTDAIYLASYDFGLYYTYNIARGWTKAEKLGNSTILDVVVDPKDKCTVYVAVSDKVLRTIDCSRSWEQIYLDPNPGKKVTAIAIDHYDTNNLYVGNNNKDMFKSVDGGKSWKRIKIFNNSIQDIIINPTDSRDLFVVTSGNNVYRFSSDSIPSFEELSRFPNRLETSDLPNLKKNFEGVDIGSNFVDLKFSQDGQVIIWATNKFLIRSNDGGLSWEKIDLLTTADKSDILAMDFNKKNPKEIYYGTKSVFMRSLDGGLSWTVIDLPTARITSDIVVDGTDPRAIYLAVRQQPESK
ncbi:MAG: hypothetical protein K9M44_02180 [Candidatus Pacebacteria bacterium]|nr:hypothetical protein [Candidatus Paceibacterota bacterium]